MPLRIAANRFLRPWLPIAWLALTLAPGVARAQAPRPPARPRPAPPSSADFKREEGRRHFEQGVALFEEGNHLGALAEFQAAYDTAPAPAILFNIGLTQKALFRYTEAIETLQRYLVDGIKDGKLTPERFTKVNQLIEEMKSLMAPVTFAIVPRTAKLTVDGRPTVLPYSGVVQLPAGTHVAEAVAEGHEPQRRQFTVAAGTAITQEMRLVKIVRTGKVRVTSSQSNTRVTIDGQDRGFAPLELELAAGGHQLEARSVGFEPLRTELMLAAGQERNVDLELRVPPATDRPVYNKWWFWTGLGTAVAGGTVAAFMLRPGTRPPLSGGLGTIKITP
jgi:hypothetical protein